MDRRMPVTPKSGNAVNLDGCALYNVISTDNLLIYPFPHQYIFSAYRLKITYPIIALHYSVEFDAMTAESIEKIPYSFEPILIPIHSYTIFTLSIIMQSLEKASHAIMYSTVS